ncbi:MAG TPA: DUF488 family protein [Steroidobacteraceae bacterium]|jgi:uncharacterized protein YeaO (DUF488 family)|nr:DUF488 family protein [Steroidobacteraceae bacterium]
MKHRAARTRRQSARPGGSAAAPRAGTVGEYSSPACYLHEVEAQPPASAEVRIKRIYEAADAADGYRALIDRLWPRGISRQRAALDAWLKELAPSNALRLWYRHDPKRWTEFGRRYRAELRAQRAALEALRARAAAGRLTLLYASREPRINHAVVLRQVLLKTSRARPLSAQS